MLSSSDLLSHPDRLLADHLRDVGAGARNAVIQLSFGSQLFDKNIFGTLGYIVGICHDFGKATTWFQRYIRNPKGGHGDSRSYHASISAFFTFYMASKILEEMFPGISRQDREQLSYVAYYVVYYHHGDLANLDDNYRTAFTDSSRLQRVTDQARDLLNIEGVLQSMYRDLLSGGGFTSNLSVRDFLVKLASGPEIRHFVGDLEDIGTRFKLLKDSNYYLKFIFLYSVLLNADKVNASGMDGLEMENRRKQWLYSLTENLVQSHKKTLEHKNLDIDELREKAYADVTGASRNVDIRNNRFLTIELPTGIGKTLTAFATSFILRERVQKEFGFTPRIVYSLPFLSIVDQNAGVAGEVLQPLAGPAGIPPDLLMEHHHLSDIYYNFRGSGESDTESYEKGDIGKRYLLMEGWNSEIVVTTFAQLFHSLITNRNASVLKFHHIANSIIILDEVQALPVRYFKLLREMLTYMAKHLNVWVILMTATMPMILSPDDVLPLVNEPDFYFSRMNRVLYHFDNSQITLPNVCNKVLEIEDGDIMVIVNTVRASQDLYLLIKKALTKKYGNPDVSKGFAVFPDTLLMNMSTRITPNDRMDRIRVIKEVGSKRKIIVSTQLVEAGVDIDVDVIFRDIAPLDSIIQAAGRANRNGLRKKGDVHVLRMVNDKGEEYSRMVYDPTLLGATETALQDVFRDAVISLDEKSMHLRVKDYYRELVRAMSSNDSEICLGYLRSMEFSKLGTEFRLIREEDKVDLFVEKEGDERAHKCWERYVAIKAMDDPVKRWKEMLRTRGEFYGYVVSVRRSIVGDTDEPISLVGKGGIALEYDREVGITDGVDSIW